LDDAPEPSQLVELTPVGPTLLVMEFSPMDDKSHTAAAQKTQRKTALLEVVEDTSRIVVRFPANTMLSEANAEEFSRELLALTKRKEHPHLLVDLGGVTMLTSTILEEIIALNSKIHAVGGRLTLFGLTPVIQQVFKVTRLDTLLEIHPSAHPLPV
jgi:anti-anti-sigma factor